MKGRRRVYLKMAIENFAEVSAYLESQKDNEEIKNYIGGLVTSDRVENFLNTEEGKKLLQPKLDSYHSKSLKSWQEKNLNSLVDAEVKKRFPDADPKDLEIQNLKKQFEQMQKEATRKDLTNKALKTLQDKKLPSDLVDYFIGQDEDTTNKNLEKFMEVMAKHDETIKTSFIKDNSYTPPTGKGDINAKKAMEDEVSKYFK